MRKLLFQTAAGFLVQKVAQVVQKDVSPKIVEAIQKPLTRDNMIGRTLAGAHAVISPITNITIVNIVAPVMAQTVQVYGNMLSPPNQKSQNS